MENFKIRHTVTERVVLKIHSLQGKVEDLGRPYIFPMVWSLWYVLFPKPSCWHLISYVLCLTGNPRKPKNAYGMHAMFAKAAVTAVQEKTDQETFTLLDDRKKNSEAMVCIHYVWKWVSTYMKTILFIMFNYYYSQNCSLRFWSVYALADNLNYVNLD